MIFECTFKVAIDDIDSGNEKELSERIAKLLAIVYFASYRFNEYGITTTEYTVLEEKEPDEF